jgi:hypothetical protein
MDSFSTETFFHIILFEPKVIHHILSVLAGQVLAKMFQGKQKDKIKNNNKIFFIKRKLKYKKLTTHSLSIFKSNHF